MQMIMRCWSDEVLMRMESTLCVSVGKSVVVAGGQYRLPHFPSSKSNMALMCIIPTTTYTTKNELDDSAYQCALKRIA